jgi:uncharacterized repeat protein (TIGR03803 family)
LEDISMKASESLLAVGLAFAAIAILAQIAAAQGATEQVIHNFNPTPHGTFPPSRLVADASGNLYGTAGGGAYNAGVLYKMAQNSPGKWTQTVLYTFSGGTNGSQPGTLVIDSAGNLYGFSTRGGTGSCYGGCGAALKFSPNAQGVWSETILFSFTTTNGISTPTGLIALDQAGNLYGVTQREGYQESESVFRLSPSGGGNWTETVLYSFGGTGGAYIFGLIADSLGNVYGTTETGGVGACECGTVFRLSPSQGGGWTHSILYSFQGGAADGSEPFSLTLDSGGNLFGTTLLGGNGAACSDVAGCGTVFELRPGSNGQWSESLLYSFGNSQLYAVAPSVLVIDSNDNLYGTTFYGGTGSRCYQACGMVFEVSSNGNGQWNEITLYNFQGGTDGYSPSFGLVLSGGVLYGTTTLGGTTDISGTIFSLAQPHGKWRLSTLYSFPFTDGDAPYAGLIADSSGNLYGTSDYGGTYDEGSIFEMSPQAGGGWSEQVIYSFDVGTANGTSVGPSALIVDSSGNLYGTTCCGGTNHAGTIFALSPSPSGGWVASTLYTFTAGSDGRNPSALTLDQLGNLYGTTYIGGTNNKGSIFELSPGSSGQWKKTVLYSFAGPLSDGEHPAGSLIFDTAGNLYGTSASGGSSADCQNGCGTLFELSPSGTAWKETVLYSFQGSSTDGDDPTASLILDTAGNLYGTTFQGGIKAQCLSNSGPPSCGVVFELSPAGNGSWTETVLHKFANSTQDGGNPSGGLVFDAAGDLYGTTGIGGTYGNGTIFKLAPSGSGWTYSVAYNFGNSPDGSYPAGNLLLDASGTFYGTTTGGGNAVNLDSNGYGTVFEFTP